MFLVTKQALRAAIKETPEGRVYYPNRRTGYVLDPVTEHSLARAYTTCFFLLVGGTVIIVLLGEQTHHQAVAFVIGVALIMAIRHAGVAYVLRHAPRSSVPFSLDDAIHRTAMTYGSVRIYMLMLACWLLVPAPLLVLHAEPTWVQATAVAVFLAFAIYASVFARRVERARWAMACSGATEGARP